MFIRLVVAGGLALAGLGVAAPAMAQSPDIVTCESRDNRTQSCRINGARDVRLYRQLSDNGCRAGRDWSFNRRNIVVRNGCRAEFLVQYRRNSGNWGDSRTVICESRNDRPNSCPAPNAQNVYIAQQLSDSRCRNGRDWSYDGRNIQVRNGCRAEFTVISGGGFGGGGGINGGGFGGGDVNMIVRCESRNSRRQVCGAGNARQVTIERQLSNDVCRRGRDWDYDGRNITVRNGCRADFLLSN